MNKLTYSLFLVAVSSLALVAIGCNSTTMMDVDAGGHPDLGTRDAGTDTGATPDLGTDTGLPPVDMGIVDGGVDMSMPVDMGPGHYTDAGCYEGTPIIMTDFLNRCTDRSTPAAVTGSGTRSPLIYPDGGVPPIP